MSNAQLLFAAVISVVQDLNPELLRADPGSVQGGTWT